MERLTTTPFGARPISAALIAQAQTLAEAPPPALPRVDKWTLLEDLRDARAAFGLGDRPLGVLSALLSFHPSRLLEDQGAPLIVFPSNARLSARAHGMAESTLRRHLAALVSAGLLARHDSPNGKRYASRDGSGGLARAFGFDLRPLVLRAAEIAEAAEAARAEALRLRRAREAASLRLRDAAKLLAYGLETRPDPAWDALAETLAEHRRALRRRACAQTFEAVAAELDDCLAQIVARLPQTEKPIADAAHSGRHHHNTNTKPSDSEPGHESQSEAESRAHPPEPTLPLGLVRQACGEIDAYADGGLRSWADLVAAAAYVRAMMGISADAWERACAAMGPPAAAVVVAAMLERFEEIRSPGGYLRALTAKAEDGAFSPVPMVMALLNRQDRRAA